MLKELKKLLRYFIILTPIILLSVFPLQAFVFNIEYEIFPAVELAIIYFYSTYGNIKYWQLFVLGIIIDQLYFTPIGISSLLFIVANYCLSLSANWFSLKEYINNIALFACYCTFIILGKLIFITIISYNKIYNLSVIFYILNTIAVYPIIYFILEKISKLFKKNVK